MISSQENIILNNQFTFIYSHDAGVGFPYNRTEPNIDGYFHQVKFFLTNSTKFNHMTKKGCRLGCCRGSLANSLPVYFHSSQLEENVAEQVNSEVAPEAGGCEEKTSGGSCILQSNSQVKIPLSFKVCIVAVNRVFRTNFDIGGIRYDLVMLRYSNATEFL